MGDQLRKQRLSQKRSLRDISKNAKVSLGYLSEVERGQKEASSELLGAICGALNLSLSKLTRIGRKSWLNGIVIELLVEGEFILLLIEIAVEKVALEGF